MAMDGGNDIQVKFAAWGGDLYLTPEPMNTLFISSVVRDGMDYPLTDEDHTILDLMLAGF